MTDWSDPCARAEALRAEYYARLSGQGTTRVAQRGGDASKEVWFQEVDIETLKTELAKAEAECATKSGAARRRFAIQAGSRRC